VFEQVEGSEDQGWVSGQSDLNFGERADAHLFLSVRAKAQLTFIVPPNVRYSGLL
jgi:hypothetical protein